MCGGLFSLEAVGVASDNVIVKQKTYRTFGRRD
jgi:hypothetical protein